MRSRQNKLPMTCGKLHDEAVTKDYMQAELATFRMQLVLFGVTTAMVLFAALKLIH